MKSQEMFLLSSNWGWLFVTPKLLSIYIMTFGQGVQILGSEVGTDCFMIIISKTI